MVYDYETSQEVIDEAWKLAIKHLKDTLGDQYNCDVTEDVLPDFFDKIEQDIKYLKECPVCGEIDIEGNFCTSEFEPSVEICYECYQEELGK